MDRIARVTDTLKAVIWDFDGTLVDTEPIWAATEQQMVAEHGVVWTDEMMRAKVGQHARISAQQMADACGKPDETDWFYDELHRRVAGTLLANDLPYLPGVVDLIHEIENEGIRASVVTASAGVILDAARNRLPDVFEFIITSDDVERTKPHPEPYLQALDRMGLTADEVIILEDSIPGTQSALAAGAAVLAFPVAQELEPHPRMMVRREGLQGIDLGALTDIWRERKDR